MISKAEQKLLWELDNGHYIHRLGRVYKVFDYRKLRRNYIRSVRRSTVSCLLSKGLLCIGQRVGDRRTSYMVTPKYALLKGGGV